MTDKNSDALSQETSADAKKSVPKAWLYILCGFIAFQFFVTWRFMPAYLELTRTGAIAPLALLFCVPANCLLYIAAILSLVSGRYRGRLFLIAAVGLGFSTCFWGMHFGQATLFGCVFGIAGWILARMERKSF